MCEAERQVKMALYEIDLQRGNGQWSLGRIQQILKGWCDCEKVGASYTQNT